MSFAIAAAGTGGHVYPGLAVGEALVASGVPHEEVLYIGGDRLERSVYPERGFPFLEVEMRGLERSLSARNLELPSLVRRASRAIHKELSERGVRAVLGMGGYVTLPAAWAARRLRVPLFVAEQNAHAGLANRIASRRAVRAFASFPGTVGLAGAEVVGNPVRRELAQFARAVLRPQSLARYGLQEHTFTLGVIGGSLGSGLINQAVADMLDRWSGGPLQVIHLAGPSHLEELARRAQRSGLRWVVLGFEPDMQYVFAASDLVVARAGGSVAELTATGTPSILVPGGFGSAGHQAANAAALARDGAARVVVEERIGELAGVIEQLSGDEAALHSMADAARRLARPNAADLIAGALREHHG